jgi:hypothetical protein
MRVVLLALLAAMAVAQKVHELCAPCHNQHAEDFQGHKHFDKGLSCDACHGESKGHREATGGKAPDRVAGPADQPAMCGACHGQQGKAYQSGKHGQLVVARAAKRAAACTTCHGTHAPRRPAAMLAQCNRCHDPLPSACKPDGCASCHNPHSLAAKK